MIELRSDVLIIGAGIAGCVAAINLDSAYRVLIVDKVVQPKPRIGESLIPASKNILKDMNLWQECLQYGVPYHGNQVLWGSRHVTEIDFIYDPNGYGLHLDRVRFELWLRKVAISRGAELLAPAVILSINSISDGWQVVLSRNNQLICVTTSVLIDASGRSSVVTSKLNIKKNVLDRLVCEWGVLPTTDHFNGMSYIEAEYSGWWYAAPIPDNRFIISYYTDSDLRKSIIGGDIEKLTQRVSNLSIMPCLLNKCSKTIDNYGFTAARSVINDASVGNRWIAVGDAAVCFDPISSQGIFNALYTGLVAAKALNEYLFSGNTQALCNYQKRIDSIVTAYMRHYRIYYTYQILWSDSVFWQRRHSELSH